MEIELEYDDVVMHNGENNEDKAWFFEEILAKDRLILHSNEIGDEIGIVKVLQIKEDK